MNWSNIFQKLSLLFSKKQASQKPVVSLPEGDGKQDGRVVFTLTTALVVVSGLAVYFWYQATDSMELDQAQNQNQTEAKKLVTEISKFLILPENEEPTIATVSDPEILKDQPFFFKAQKGDKVLIYSKSKKAILYNPATKKVVEVAPISFGSSTLPQ